ncbi:hypothetical protein FA13DRAFT_1734125, partial [Coprinellus micaceus]
MSPYGTFPPRAIRQHAQRLGPMFFEERNAKKVFDAYIPSEYINHISSAPTRGRRCSHRTSPPPKQTQRRLGSRHALRRGRMGWCIIGGGFWGRV